MIYRMEKGIGTATDDDEIKPDSVYFDREQVCAQLTVYSEFCKYKKKFPSMKDKTVIALKANDKKIKRFLTLQKHGIQKKENSKFRFSRIKPADKKQSILNFMKIKPL